MSDPAASGMTCPLCTARVTPRQLEGGMVRVLLWLQDRTGITFIKHEDQDTAHEQEED